MRRRDLPLVRPGQHVLDGYVSWDETGHYWEANPSGIPNDELPCVVVTGRTAQDVERLLREPTDEDIARAARALWDAEGMRMYHGSFDRADGYLRRKYLAIAHAAIAAYRSPEEADHA